MGEFNYNAVDRSSLYVLQSVTSCDFPWPPRLPPGTRHHRKEGGREARHDRDRQQIALWRQERRAVFNAVLQLLLMGAFCRETSTESCDRDESLDFTISSSRHHKFRSERLHHSRALPSPHSIPRDQFRYQREPFRSNIRLLQSTIEDRWLIDC